MRSLLLAAAAALGIAAAAHAAVAAPSAPPTARPKPSAQKGTALPFQISVKSLPNGLTVLFVPYDSPGLTAYYSLVRVGSRNEVEPGRSGFAHFFEHMMFRGTKRFPSEVYDELLAKNGIAHNAFTTDDFTAYHNFGPSDRLPLVIELEADRFQNLEYSRDAFRTEALAVLGEYNKNYSNPLEKLEEVLRDTAFTRHTYKHTTMGFREDIEAMPGLYEYSLEFFERWYTPDNTTLLLVGDFDPAKVEQLIAQHYGGWKGKVAKVAVPSEPKQAAPRAVHLSWPNPTQPRVVFAWHTPEARVDAPDAAIQNVLGPYLYGPTSPTYRDLVLERQLLTDLSIGYYDHRDPSLFYLVATLKSDDTFTAVQEALGNATAELRDGKVDEKRLADVKSNQKYGVLNSFDNAETVALQLAFAIGPTGDPRALDALLAHIEELTPAQLVAFAKRWLVDANRTSVTLSGAGAKAPPGAVEYAPKRHSPPPPSATPNGGRQ